MFFNSMAKVRIFVYDAKGKTITRHGFSLMLGREKIKVKNKKLKVASMITIYS